MKLEYDVKFEITEEEKEKILSDAYHRRIYIIVLSFTIALCVGAIAGIILGWGVGFAVFFIVALINLFAGSKIQNHLLYSDIDYLMKLKMNRV